MGRKTKTPQSTQKPEVTKPAKEMTRTAKANLETTKPLEMLPKVKRSRLGGVMYIGRLPKGFEEPQLRQFFEQFGAVVRVCVARARKTQRPKGYGYVQFAFYEVAEIAAAAVNNYMLFTRVLRADVLPKTMSTIPRNFGRVFNSKGEQTEAHKAWAEKQINKSNAYVGNQVLLSHRVKQLRRVKRAKQVLEAAGVEVPEMNTITSKLQQHTGELKQPKLSAPEQETPAEPEKNKEDSDSDPDDEVNDDEDFAPLDPSEWDQGESTSVENVENRATRASAIKKAQLRAKELHMNKLQSTKEKVEKPVEPVKSKKAQGEAKAASVASPLAEKNQTVETGVAVPKAPKTKRVANGSDRTDNANPVKTRRILTRS